MSSVILLAAVAVFVVLLFLAALGINAWMKRGGTPLAARVFVTTLAFVLPMLAIAAVGFFFVAFDHDADRPAAVVQERIVIREPRAVVRQPVAQVPRPLQPDQFPGRIDTHGGGHANVGISGLNLSVLSIISGAAVLALLAVMIGLNVWMKQRGATISLRAVVLGGVSLLWLVPVFAVLVFAGWAALARNSATELARSRAELERSRAAAKATSESAYATLQEDARNANGNIREAQPLGTEAVTQTPHPLDPPATLPATAQPPAPVAASPPPAVASGESSPQVVPTTQPPKDQADPASALPTWVTRGTVEEGDRILTVVTSEQFQRVEDANAQALELATQLINTEFHARHREAAGWNVPADVIMKTAVRDNRIEVIERRTSTSDTPFRVHRAYLQVELSPQVYGRILDEWRVAAVDQRLKGLGALGGLLTLVFATSAVYLRLDDRTAGAYRGRLRLAAVSLIVAGGLAAAALV